MPTANANLLGPLVSETFVNNAVVGTAVFTATGATGSTTDGPVTISYNAATQSYTLSSATGTISFGPGNIDPAQSNAGAVVYARTNGDTTDTLTLTRPGTSGRVTYTYVGAAFWQRTVQTNSNRVDGAINAVTYGVATPDAAVPRTGQATFAVDLIGARTVNNNLAPIAGSGSMFVNFATGAITTTGRVTSGGVQNGAGNNPFSGVAQLASGTNGFTGTFRLDDFGTFIGTMNGRLYGPNADEIGAAIRAIYDNQLLVATLTGRRAAATQANAQFNDVSAGPNIKLLTFSELFAGDAATISTRLSGVSGSNFTSGIFSETTLNADGLSIYYDSDQQSYTVTAPDRTQNFTQNGGTINGAQSTETLVLGARTPQPTTGQAITLNYTRAGQWTLIDGSSPTSTRYRLGSFNFGIVTPDSATPRTGTANFRLVLNGNFADADFPNLMRVSGSGVLEANFATGALRGLGTLDYREDFTLSGRAVAVPTGNFDLTAQLASDANRFNGTINLSGIGAYTGALTGRFFGPNADEVGGTFSVRDGNGGVGAGTIVGARDATATLPPPSSALLGLSGPTPLASSEAIVGSSANVGRIIAVNFDPTTNRYVLGFSDTGQQGSPTTNLTLDAASRVAGTSTASLTQHSGTFRGSPYTAAVSVPGATNPTIALTYTGYATLLSGAPGFETRYHVHYGIATPSQTMPRTGSANYAGIITGHGSSTLQNVPGPVTEYALSGTGTLAANFANATLTSVMNIVGSVINGTGTRDFGSFTHNGAITGSTFFAGINRDSLAGTFYGPNADEFAALFGITRFNPVAGSGDTQRVELDGIFVGRRPPP